jgi:uncharacterized Zn-finger protein
MVVPPAIGHGTSVGTRETERDISMGEFGEPKIIHTKTFSCAEDHPIVYYTVDKDNKAVCEYCYTKFLYEPKDFHTKMKEEQELLDMSLKESIKQKKERTTSEKMQDNLEPIDNYANKILKGSG